MIAIYLAPVYLLVCIYILLRTLNWIRVLHVVFQNVWVCRGIGLIYLFVVFSILIAFMAPASGFRRFMKLLSNYWLGVLVYMIMTVGIADGLRLLLKYPLKNLNFPGRALLFGNVGTAVVGVVCAVIITTVSIYGMINAGNIQTTKYDISIDKKAGNLDSLNVVLIADLHLGYNIGCRHMEKMVDKINAQNPDLVVVAGDIFDNEYEALENPDRLAAILRGIQSKYGVYACYGNHDIQEKILAGFTFGGKEKKESSVKMDKFLEKAGITLLRDEYTLIDNSFYLYGRPDYERPGRGIDERKSPQEITADMDLSLPVLVIDHEPRELQELADAGVDADLCGHTHDGQLFPGNLTIKLMWENACGYLKKDNMHSIVTSGVGLFGPNMRVGTKSEICDIMIHFK
ncbi:metallophosphoesterase [Blautia sp.]